MEEDEDDERGKASWCMRRDMVDERRVMMVIQSKEHI